MPPNYLQVPFEEKDQAKALGARWDPGARCWFVPDGADPVLFKRWLNVSGYNLSATRFGLALNVVACWKCRAPTQVACVVLGPGHEELEFDEDDEAEFWEEKEYAGALQDVTWISQEALKVVQEVAPWLKMAYSQTTKSSYIGNVCVHCAALQGDFFLHQEPGGAFCPMNEQDAGAIEVWWFDTPIQAKGSAGMYQEWVA